MLNERGATIGNRTHQGTKVKVNKTAKLFALKANYPSGGNRLGSKSPNQHIAAARGAWSVIATS
jgi:hypothetical protein